MRKELTLLSTLGFAWALNLGACAGPELLVGANAGKSGSGGVTSGTGNDGVTSGTGGSSVTPGVGGADVNGTGGSGVGGTSAVAAGGTTGGTSGGSAAQSGGTDAGAGPTPSSVMGGPTTNYYLNQIRFSPDVDAPQQKCLPRRLAFDAAGQAPCQIYPVTALADGQTCHCDAPGFGGPPEGGARDTVIDYLRSNGYCSEPDQPPCDCSSPPQPLCENLCICQLRQAQGSDLTVCQSGQAPTDSNGWCYVSPDEGLGDPSLVSECQPTARSTLLFYGDSARSSDALSIIGCFTQNPPLYELPEAAPLGAPCLLGDEYRQDFYGYAMTEANVETQSPACASGVCIANHFQGRVSCPYGQTPEEASDPRCYIPGSDANVTVPVQAQLLERAAADHVICSCRCDGPGDGPFCACPGDMECAPLIHELGLPGDESLAGSYCVRKGTAYDPQGTVQASTCDPALMNCGDPRPY